MPCTFFFFNLTCLLVYSTVTFVFFSTFRSMFSSARLRCSIFFTSDTSFHSRYIISSSFTRQLPCSFITLFHLHFQYKLFPLRLHCFVFFTFPRYTHYHCQVCRTKRGTNIKESLKKRGLAGEGEARERSGVSVIKTNYTHQLVLSPSWRPLGSLLIDVLLWLLSSPATAALKRGHQHSKTVKLLLHFVQQL